MKTNWYALYTAPRSEKKVHARLIEQGIEAYLPLQKKLRQWKDRKKWVEVPLINSYIFVNITPQEYMPVISTVGVLRFVYFLGKAAVIPEKQINALKQILESEKEIDISSENIKEGDKIKVIAGSLIGLEGELVSIRGNKKIIIRIDHLGYSISVNIPITDVVIVRKNE